MVPTVGCFSFLNIIHENYLTYFSKNWRHILVSRWNWIAFSCPNFQSLCATFEMHIISANLRIFSWRSSNTVLWIYLPISDGVTSFGRPRFGVHTTSFKLCHPTFYCRKQNSKLLSSRICQTETFRVKVLHHITITYCVEFWNNLSAPSDFSDFLSNFTMIMILRCKLLNIENSLLILENKSIGRTKEIFRLVGEL